MPSLIHQRVNGKLYKMRADASPRGDGMDCSPHFAEDESECFLRTVYTESQVDTTQANSHAIRNRTE